MSRSFGPTTREPISPWPFIGMGALACVLFLYGASVLLAPWYAVTFLVVLWLVLFAVACRWWTPHPRRIIWLAGFAAVFWFAFIIAGGAWLDWTA